MAAWSQAINSTAWDRRGSSALSLEKGLTAKGETIQVVIHRGLEPKVDRERGRQLTHPRRIGASHFGSIGERRGGGSRFSEEASAFASRSTVFTRRSLPASPLGADNAPRFLANWWRSTIVLRFGTRVRSKERISETIKGCQTIAVDASSRVESLRRADDAKGGMRKERSGENEGSLMEVFEFLQKASCSLTEGNHMSLLRRNRKEGGLGIT